MADVPTYRGRFISRLEPIGHSGGLYNRERTTAAIAAAAIALAGTIPAMATTFPSLTLIYVASGVTETWVASADGIATVVNRTNMSGQTASVRYQFRYENGTPAAGGTLLLANLATHSITTQSNVDFLAEIALPTGNIFGGVVQILSTQSAVYCSAMLVHASAQAELDGPAGAALHMVRFNPHPGTVE